MAMSLGIVSILLATIAAAVAEEECKTGAWSDWSKCKLTTKHCTASRSSPTSHQIAEGVDIEKGQEIMTAVMAYKRKLWEKNGRARLSRSGELPELRMLPECGVFKCADGLAGTIPCSNVDQLDFLSFDDMGYKSPPGEDYLHGNDMWGWVDPDNADEYAIMGITGGTTFVRITDPVKSVPVGVIYTETYSSAWRDIKVIGNYAYIVSEARNHGLQVFDLTRLRGVSSVQTFLPDATHKGFGNSHNLVANEATNTLISVGSRQQYEYNNTCNGGLYIMNVNDPLNPRFETCFGDDGYTHDAQCVIYNGPDKRFTRQEICFSFNEVAFTVTDITDRKNIKILSRTTYPNYGYVHQGWITDDMTVAVMDDELDEMGRPSNEQFTKTYVWDIRNLKKIKLKTIFESPERSIDHNQYIVGNLVYQANYQAGLRILHLDQPAYKLTQVGYFDVFPSGTAAEFQGAWSVYPYYPSGTVAISSIDYGLFLVKPDHEAINALIASGDETAEMSRTRPLVSAAEGAHCPPLVETKTCDAPTPEC